MNARQEPTTRASAASPRRVTVDGRLDGTLDGRPFSLIAGNGRATFHLPHLSSVPAARRHWPLAKSALGVSDGRLDCEIRVKVARFPAVTVFPRPNRLVSLFLR